ncbi:hypothetical protein NQ315_006073 [Exocentrus adspersus]|uniref:PiggyBac transposable element-derived protein domain-containing protein n=1 Tax=Exocentrus adspersus TaxID=1586481 RepID=A0AAV8VGA6_9CUCU|nr:hypothetical protein NQ315_006073 [Exocentrus adspersus]
MVTDYKAHMGYVDKVDMLKSVYEIDRKSKKWWHHILWYFVDICVVNSFILLKTKADSTIPTLKNFRLSVGTGLIGAPQQPRSRAAPSVRIWPISSSKVNQGVALNLEIFLNIH